jgi:hypothetical protein
MSERVLTTVSLFTSSLVQENLLMTSPSRQFFNLTKQLLTQTLQLSFSPSGPLLALADPSRFTLLLNNRTYTPSSTKPFTFAVPLTDLSSLLTTYDYLSPISMAPSVSLDSGLHYFSNTNNWIV